MQSAQTLITGCLLSENKSPQKRTTYKIIFLIHLIAWVYWDLQVKKFKEANSVMMFLKQNSNRFMHKRDQNPKQQNGVKLIHQLTCLKLSMLAELIPYF